MLWIKIGPATRVVACNCGPTEVKAGILMLESLQGEFLLHLVIGVRVGCVLTFQQAVPAVLSQALRLNQDDYDELVVLCGCQTKVGLSKNNNCTCILYPRLNL